MKKNKLIAAALLLAFSAISCGNSKTAKIEKFRGTEGYALMQAVAQEDTARIQAIAKERLYVINLQNLKDGETPICTAVQMDKFKSFSTLLNVGADPDRNGFTKGTSATDYAKKLAADGDSRYIDAINAMGR